MADAVAKAAPGTGAGAAGGGTTNGGSGGRSGPGMMSRLVAFYHGVMAEMRKVTWPDFPQVRQATISIIIFVLLLALAITLMDLVLQGLLIKLIPTLFAGR